MDIKIDQSAPEFLVEFDLAVEDLVVRATDNLDPDLSCSLHSCLATDEAGNTTEISFEQKVKKDRISLYSISYNGSNPERLPHNKFAVQYREKKDILKDFDQYIVIKGDEKARVNYQKKKDQSVVTQKLKGEKKTREIFPGIKFLQLLTKKGMLDVNIK